MKKFGQIQLFPIAALDNLQMVFSRNTKHLTIFKVTEILTLFSADMPTCMGELYQLQLQKPR